MCQQLPRVPSRGLAAGAQGRAELGLLGAGLCGTLGRSPAGSTRLWDVLRSLPAPHRAAVCWHFCFASRNGRAAVRVPSLKRETSAAFGRESQL